MEIGVGRRRKEPKEQRKEGRKRTELYLASKGDAACRAADHGGARGISVWMRAGVITWIGIRASRLSEGPR